MYPTRAKLQRNIYLGITLGKTSLYIWSFGYKWKKVKWKNN